MPTDYKKIILDALDKVRKEEGLLSSNISERCLTHRLALYLGKAEELKRYIIDCEYNRKEGGDPKKCDGKIMTPDIIVHRTRGDNSENLIVIEAKKSNNLKDGGRRDKERLECYRDYFSYQNAFFVVFPVRKQELNEIQDGKRYLSSYIKVC